MYQQNRLHGRQPLPATLGKNSYWTDADVTNSRTLKMTVKGRGTPFSFDNAGYDMNTINESLSFINKFEDYASATDS